MLLSVLDRTEFQGRLDVDQCLRGFLGGLDPKFANQCGIYSQTRPNMVMQYLVQDHGTQVSFILWPSWDWK